MPSSQEQSHFLDVCLGLKNLKPWSLTWLGTPQWTQQLVDALRGEWQERYNSRPRDWREVYSIDEMLATIDSIVDCNNTHTWIALF